METLQSASAASAAVLQVGGADSHAGYNHNNSSNNNNSDIYYNASSNNSWSLLLHSSSGDDTTTLTSADVEPQPPPLIVCGVFFFVVYGPLLCSVCVVGIIGNSLSFFVLHKYSRDTVATFLLKALAVSDSVFLATALFVHAYPAMFMYFGLVEQLRPVYPYLQIYAWPLAHMVQMGSVYMMVLVAANRYIAVCKALQAQRLCTKRSVVAQILVMTLAIVVYNVPRFFEWRYVYHNVTTSANVTELVEVNVGLVQYEWYNILYENVSYLIFVFLLPLLVLTVFNVHLVFELRKASACRKNLSSGKRSDENNITLVMIVIILIFIICQAPASLNQVLFYTLGIDERTCTNYERYYHLSNLFIIMNSSTNFFVYCLFRRQFRAELWALVCCYECRSKGPRPLRRTLIRRALHQHNSLSHSFTRSFVAAGSLREKRKSCDVTSGQQIALLNNHQPPPTRRALSSSMHRPLRNSNFSTSSTGSDVERRAGGGGGDVVRVISSVTAQSSLEDDTTNQQAVLV